MKGLQFPIYDIIMQKPKNRGSVKIESEEAKDRKFAEELKCKAIKDREKEDKSWQEDGHQVTLRYEEATAREEDAKKREEATARKAETRGVAEEEEKQLEKNLKKNDKKVAKVTEAELRRRREEEQAAIGKRVEQVKRRQSRTTSAKEYQSAVLVKNMNRDSSIIDACTIEDAIDQLTIKAQPKASWKGFDKAKLPRMKGRKQSRSYKLSAQRHGFQAGEDD